MLMLPITTNKCISVTTDGVSMTCQLSLQDTHCNSLQKSIISIKLIQYNVMKFEVLFFSSIQVALTPAVTNTLHIVVVKSVMMTTFHDIIHGTLDHTKLFIPVLTDVYVF